MQDSGKYDDPINVSQNIINEIKKIGISLDISPVKLKSGTGEVVCYIILQLSDRALKVKKFNFSQKPKFAEGKKLDEEPQIDEDGDPNMDMAEQIEMSDEDLEENILDQQAPIDEEKQVIQSKTDSKEWILECERVSSKLKFSVKSSAKEWRSHIENSKQYKQQITQLIPSVRTDIEKITDNLEKVLDEVVTRETKINNQMSGNIQEYRTQSDDYKRIAQRYNTLNSNVKELSDQYRTISEKLQTIKENDVTDHTPLMRIKAAMETIREDIKQMDLRIGVLNHTILQHKFKQHQSKHDKKESGIHHLDLDY